MTDVFAIQDDIARAIAAALRVALVGAATYTPVLPAYESLLRGRHHRQEAHAVLARPGPDLLQRGRGRGPCVCGPSRRTGSMSAAARCQQRPAYEERVFGNPRGSTPRAREISIGQRPALAAGSHGRVVRLRLDGGSEAFSKAIGVSTVSGYSRWLHASFYLGPLGRYDEAVAQMRQAVEHDPLNVTWRTNLGIALHALNRNDEAQDQLQKALEIDPQNWGSHFILGQTAMATGDLPAAVAAAERAHAVHPQHSMPSGLPPRLSSGRETRIAQRHSSVSRAIRQPRSTEGPCITSTVRRSIRRPRVGRR